jgi:hypothetical protein
MATELVEQEEEIEIDEELLRDMRWALRNCGQPVMKDWHGDHIAVYNQKVILAGDDPDEVMAKAVKATGVSEGRIVVFYRGRNQI